MKSKSGKKTKAVIINVTEKDYRRSKAKGIEEVALLKPGRHKFTRGANPLIRAGLPPVAPPLKTRISILLDEDVIKHFKKRAAAPNALPYQTQINKALRAAMMADRGDAVEVEDEGVAPQKNPTFIKAVARSVKAQLAQERKRQRKRA